MVKPLEQTADSLARPRFLQGRGPDDASLRVMLLTSSLGAGHMMASRALEAALQERNPGMEIETMDVWSLMDPAVAGAVRQAYLDTITEEPRLYDDVYCLGQQTWRSLFDASEFLPRRLETLIDHFSARVAQPNGSLPDPVAGDPHPSDRVLLRYLHASLARRRRNGAAARRCQASASSRNGMRLGLNSDWIGKSQWCLSPAAVLDSACANSVNGFSRRFPGRSWSP